MFYKQILRPILFLMPAETMHNLAMFLLSLADRSKKINNFIFKLLNYTSPRLKQKQFDLYFRTPVGLAAGMDKKAAAPLLWSAFDFGWAELGSFTFQPYQGNPKPRLWRLIKEQGIIVHLGLPNVGAAAIATKLKTKQKRYAKRGLLAISIAKSPPVPLDQAPDDYAQSFGLLAPLADIITINLSCPNVSDYAGLQRPTLLEPILQKLTALNTHSKPIWLKIGNDLNNKELDDVIALLKKYKISAVIAANLSKDRDRLNLPDKFKDKPGGVSGRLISQRANEIISYLYKNSENKFIVVGCGGIFNGQDAFTKIKAGASLLQLATGFIFEGPTVIKKINKELDQLLAKNNFNHISSAVGLEADSYHHAASI